MPPSSVAGPDFICVGLPKSGTGWLFDQLKYHPDFWMPPVKELAYLNRPILELKEAERQLRNMKKQPEKHRRWDWSNREQGDDRDYQFLQEATEAIGEAPDIERYMKLFRYKNGALSGDISSGYCALNRNMIKLIAERLPQTKIVLFVRDPVDRAWSHVSMWQRARKLRGDNLESPAARKFDYKVLENPVAFRSLLENTKSFMRTSFPSAVVRAWHDAAPQLSFRAFLFDDIREKPEETRGEVLSYLDADPQPQSGELAAGHNKKANSEKLELAPAIHAQLIDMFADEIRKCAELFGGQAKAWPGRYGL